MKIFGKHLTSISTVALICSVVGFIGWYGITRSGRNPHEVGTVNRQEIKGLMVINADDLNSGYDHPDRHWTEFRSGWKIFAGIEKARGDAAELEKAEKALDYWRGESERLTALVREVRLDDVRKIRAGLLERRNDHQNWVRELEAAVASGKPFTGQLDPQLCALGRWLSVFETDNAEFSAILDRFKAPHRKLHGLGAKVDRLLAAGDKEQAAEVLRTEVLPTLNELDSVFNQANESAYSQSLILKEALGVGFGSESRTFGASTSEIDSSALKSGRNADRFGSKAEVMAGRSKVWSLLAVLVGVSCAMGFGSLISRLIFQPIRQPESGAGIADRTAALSETVTGVNRTVPRFAFPSGHFQPGRDRRPAGESGLNHGALSP